MILKCKTCGNYTLKEVCCNKKTERVRPMKYSPEDKYGRYRRLAKEKNVENNDS